MGPRAGLDGRKFSSPPGFDPGPSSPWSVAITTELPGPQPTMKALSCILGRLNHISHNISIIDGQARLNNNWTRIDDNISTNAKEGRFSHDRQYTRRASIIQYR